eukprot:PLAT11662.1.p1 GENE.PLAT11662.1~~PLAT11662.1.p1  ORF type:complete len:659 (+),score=315.30 PLAT11662.1:98-2074(+)
MATKISQLLFDEAVRENIEEFEMSGEEALADTIEQFKLSGVDLTGIKLRVPGSEAEEAAAVEAAKAKVQTSLEALAECSGLSLMPEGDKPAVVEKSAEEKGAEERKIVEALFGEIMPKPVVEEDVEAEEAGDAEGDVPLEAEKEVAGEAEVAAVAAEAAAAAAAAEEALAAADKGEEEAKDAAADADAVAVVKESTEEAGEPAIAPAPSVELDECDDCGGKGVDLVRESGKCGHCETESDPEAKAAAIAAREAIEAILRRREQVIKLGTADELPSFAEAAEELSGEREAAMLAALAAVNEAVADEDWRAFAGKAGGMWQAVEVVAYYRRTRSVVLAGLRLLTTLLHKCDENRMRVGFVGARSIVLLLDAFREDEEVTTAALSVAKMACLKNEKAKVAFAEMGISPLLVHALGRYGENATTVKEACWAIILLVNRDDLRAEACKGFVHARGLFDDGLIPVLLPTLKAHEDSEELVSLVFNAIKHMAVNNDICKSIAVDEYLLVLLEALDKHRSIEKLAQRGAAMLKTLAFSDDQKRAIAAKGGIGLLLKLLHAHGGSAGVVNQVLAATASLLLRQPDIAKMVADADGIGMLVRAMAVHKDDAQVMRSGSLFVRNMVVHNAEHIPLLLEEGVEPLLQDARRRFHICVDVAYAALRDMGRV